MEIPDFIRESASPTLEIKTIEMHTTGEPTRIVVSGYPDLSGTLLEQRAEALTNHDHIRRALICEPRGHKEMYGAVLRPRTELVDAGEAHIGVLFLTNDGYSTMCGHATLAVARMLVDQASAKSSEGLINGCEKNGTLSAFDYDRLKDEVLVKLHLPCGLVHVTVPIIESIGCIKTDTTRPISYLSVPSYTTGIWVTVPIPPEQRWTELGDRESVVIDVAYGGAFYIIVPVGSLGFGPSLSGKIDLHALNEATKKLKEAFNGSNLRKFYLYHPDHADLQFLYGTIVTDSSLGTPVAGTTGAETGLCFFANGQVDRSPTGSGVQAKVALAYAKGKVKIGERRTHHSLLSIANGGEGGFVGEAVKEVDVGGRKGVIVKVSGCARYTGVSSFMIEKDDEIGKGFWFD